MPLLNEKMALWNVIDVEELCHGGRGYTFAKGPRFPHRAVAPRPRVGAHIGSPIARTEEPL